jgi:hypothetical protein
MINRVFSFIAILLLYYSCATTGASEIDPDLAIIYSLYKEYAWVAIFDQTQKVTPYLGKEIEFESEEVLNRYFEPSFSKLIVSDRKCVEQRKEECALEADLLYSSQDVQVIGMRIEKAGDNRVVVKYTYPSSRQKIMIEYDLVQINNTKKIYDIRYFSGEKSTSLRESLRGFPKDNP